MPPSQNAGSSDIVRSSRFMRKIGASARGLVADRPLAVHDRLRGRRAARGVDDEGVVGRRHLRLDAPRGARRPTRRRRRAPGARRSGGPMRCPSASSSQIDRRCGAHGEPQRRGAGVGQAGQRRFEVRREVVAQEPPGADEELHVARPDDVGELGRRREGADRRDERADAERGVERRQQRACRRVRARRCGSPCRHRSRAAPWPCGPSAGRARA